MQRAIRTAEEALLSPIIVVIRHQPLATVAKFAETKFIVNPNADEGIASSIRCGIEATPGDVSGAIIMTCDQPAVTAPHLRALHSDLDRITGSFYANTIGVPAYFPARAFSELRELRGDSGARALLRNAHAVATNDLELDIDTQQDLDRARVLFE